MTNPVRAFPARLHVLLASQAPVAVVIRRGPSKSVCSLLWHRHTDQFEVGQWLRGRIYERRSDLSPDGKHLVYFASNGKAQWTAISRAPWLKADVFLTKDNCWHGGGLFTSKTSYWINDGYGHARIRDDQRLMRDWTFDPGARYGGECPSVYYVRLQRDAWTLVGRGAGPGPWNNWTIFEKSNYHGWILRKIAHEALERVPGRSCYWDEHELEHPTRKVLLKCPEWEWAEFDSGSLVWAEKGRLLRATLGKKDLRPGNVIFDANEMTFQSIAAPY